MIKSIMFKSNITRYLNKLNVDAYRYRSSVDSDETLYASCFALMIYYFINEISRLSDRQISEWGDYILSFQDPGTGYFVGPEISCNKILKGGHSIEHLSMHLTAHVLPVLSILGIKPKYVLKFAHKYTDIVYLDKWLKGIDWTKAWIEGNNLLFVGQFLVYLNDEERFDNIKTKNSLDYLMQWLDAHVDPNTGVWGTNGYCDLPRAIYGGYHQLLLYHYLGRDVLYKEKLIDSVLSIQHLDGGFYEYFGGGTCEDVDCVDILVNLYKITDYRKTDIENALRKAAANIIRKHNHEGGFYYRKNQQFHHNSMECTYAAPNNANIFSTWFSIHTLCLINEIISMPILDAIDYEFNKTCSMGWHKKWSGNRKTYYALTYYKVITSEIIYKLYYHAVNIKDSTPIITKIYNMIRRA